MDTYTVWYTISVAVLANSREEALSEADATLFDDGVFDKGYFNSLEHTGYDDSIDC